MAGRRKSRGLASRPCPISAGGTKHRTEDAVETRRTLRWCTGKRDRVRVVRSARPLGGGSLVFTCLRPCDGEKSVFAPRSYDRRLPWFRRTVPATAVHDGQQRRAVCF